MPFTHALPFRHAMSAVDTPEKCYIGTIDSLGRQFNRFEVRKDYCARPNAKWVVFGRNEAYNDSLIMVCAFKSGGLDATQRKGWRTKREAQVIADAMNAEIPAHSE